MSFFNKKFKLGLIAITLTQNSFAADKIDLVKIPITNISTLIHLSQNKKTNSNSDYSLVSKHIDSNSTSHLRVQQTWKGIPIWGGDAVLHIPKQNKAKTFTQAIAEHDTRSWMNGTAWNNLQSDLTTSPKKAFTKNSSQSAIKKIHAIYTEQTGTRIPNNAEIQNIIFIDKKNNAHWAWQVKFIIDSPNLRPAIPTFIIDAISYKIYKQWNNLQTSKVFGGGYGGNPKIGKLIYDGLKKHLPKLNVTRDDQTQICSLDNNEIVVEDRNRKFGDTITTYPCKTKDKYHNYTYWNGNLRSTNGAYSPDNDAFFIGHVVQNLYSQWYGVPALIKENGKALKLIMRVHDYRAPNNAYWDGKEMSFGDGGDFFYPFTVLNIGAHEISHGFTEEHSNLIYSGQSGGLNESFSDMAGAAANYFAYGKNTWQLGVEIVKNSNRPFRYMDHPSKDCKYGLAGFYCSIDKASQYSLGVDLKCLHYDLFGRCTKKIKSDLNVHHSSGVFNRAFYLLATTRGWNTHKAFDVMVKANQDYWVKNTTFKQAACGVKYATRDLKYSVADVSRALNKVDLDIKNC